MVFIYVISTNLVDIDFINPILNGLFYGRSMNGGEGKNYPSSLELTSDKETVGS